MNESQAEVLLCPLDGRQEVWSCLHVHSRVSRIAARAWQLPDASGQQLEAHGIDQISPPTTTLLMLSHIVSSLDLLVVAL